MPWSSLRRGHSAFPPTQLSPSSPGQPRPRSSGTACQRDRRCDQGTGVCQPPAPCRGTVTSPASRGDRTGLGCGAEPGAGRGSLEQGAEEQKRRGAARGAAHPVLAPGAGTELSGIFLCPTRAEEKIFYLPFYYLIGGVLVGASMCRGLCPGAVQAACPQQCHPPRLRVSGCPRRALLVQGCGASAEWGKHTEPRGFKKKLI